MRWSSSGARRALRRVFPEAELPAQALFAPDMQAARQSPVDALFRGGRWARTLLLWGSFYFAFMILVVNSTWSPLLLKSIGIAVGSSALALATFNFGSLIGSAAGGWLLGRCGVRLALGMSFAASAATFAAMGVLAPHIGWLVLGQGLFGVLIGCASSGLIAFSAICYQPSARSTGVGWAMALGRIGSFCGPLLVAVLVARGWPAGQIFLAMGATILIGVVCTFAQAGSGKASGHGG
jgi:AAHS family 4-hydroxybenzoate transporter-like MFS transporter